MLELPRVSYEGFVRRADALENFSLLGGVVHRVPIHEQNGLTHPTVLQAERGNALLTKVPMRMGIYPLEDGMHSVTLQTMDGTAIGAPVYRPRYREPAELAALQGPFVRLNTTVERRPGGKGRFTIYGEDPGGELTEIITPAEYREDMGQTFFINVTLGVSDTLNRIRAMHKPSTTHPERGVHPALVELTTNERL